MLECYRPVSTIKSFLKVFCSGKDLAWAEEFLLMAFRTSPLSLHILSPSHTMVLAWRTHLYFVKNTPFLHTASLCCDKYTVYTYFSSLYLLILVTHVGQQSSREGIVCARTHVLCSLPYVYTIYMSVTHKEYLGAIATSVCHHHRTTHHLGVHQFIKVQNFLLVGQTEVCFVLRLEVKKTKTQQRF